MLADENGSQAGSRQLEIFGAFDCDGQILMIASMAVTH